MSRWLPHPWLSAGLLGVWLLLNQSLAPGQLLLGALLGVVLAWPMARLEPEPLVLRRPRVLLRLAGAVLADITRSNLAVARVILRPAARRGEPGFVRIRLELRNRYGLAALAAIITSTPGTLWVGYDSGTGVLMIHVLDLVDAASWERTIKERYERPLREIFE